MSLTASEYKNISNLLKLSSPVIIHILIKSHSAMKQFSPLHHCSSNLMQLDILNYLCFCSCVSVFVYLSIYVFIIFHRFCSFLAGLVFVHLLIYIF